MPTADLVTSKIMTRINPDGRTYRLPLMNNGTLRIDGSKTSLAAFGDAIDKLGMKGNVYFKAEDCNTQKDIICKLLEWCSRPIAKGEPYRQEKRNKEWKESLLSGYNEYLGTEFTQEDMYWIYDKLGNAVNHELTLKFIASGYDLNLVYPKKGESHGE